MIDVLSVASEAYPLIKTGGLADVAGALPGALSPHGVLMRTLIPGYPAVMREAVTGGFADSRCMQVHGQRMVDGAFQPGFKSELHAKDAGIVERMAAETGTPIRAFDVARDALDHLVETGRGDLDDSAVIEIVREQAEGNA